MANVDTRLKPPEALSDGQKDCLRLVMQHFSSKEIARSLGVSPHTVDKRLKLAISAMGVQSRVEAARKLAVAEGGLDPIGLVLNQSPNRSTPAPLPTANRDQALVYQSPDLSRHSDIVKSGSLTGEWNPAADRSGGMLHEGQAAFLSRSSPQARTGFLGLLVGGEAQVNDLSVAARMVAMAGIVSGSILAFAVSISVIEGLSRLY